MADKFQECRIKAARTLQLAVGAPPLVKPQAEQRFEEVAEKEFKEGKIPLKVVKTKKF